MPTLLTNDALKNSLHMEYDSKKVLSEAKDKRKLNIESFFGLGRGGLEYRNKEARLQLYETLENEHIYIQYPGKESIGNPAFPYDFRPKVKMKNGAMMQDASFGFIWDILDSIKDEHKAYLSYIATLFIHMSYLYNYQLVNNHYPCESVKVIDGHETFSNVEEVELEWYTLGISDDVWYTLNDRIGLIQIPDGEISFECFIKFVDLLFQNEDCKYFFKKEILSNGVFDWNGTGRPNTCNTNLKILYYLEGEETLSNLLNSIQKGRGVMSFRKADYSVVSNNMVVFPVERV